MSLAGVEEEVRCPACAKLLARRASDGAAVIARHGEKIAAIRDGDIACSRCGRIVPVLPAWVASGADRACV